MWRLTVYWIYTSIPTIGCGPPRNGTKSINALIAIPGNSFKARFTTKSRPGVFLPLRASMKSSTSPLVARGGGEITSQTGQLLKHPKHLTLVFCSIEAVIMLVGRQTAPNTPSSAETIPRPRFRSETLRRPFPPVSARVILHRERERESGPCRSYHTRFRKH